MCVYMCDAKQRLMRGGLGMQYRRSRAGHKSKQGSVQMIKREQNSLSFK